MDVPSDGYLTVSFFFKSFSELNNYKDALFESLVIFISNKHTWPTEYEEYREEITLHNTFLTTYQGTEHSGKRLVVNENGYIST